MIKGAVGKDLDHCRRRQRTKPTEKAKPRCSCSKGHRTVGPQWSVDRDETRRAGCDGESEIGSLEQVQMFAFILRGTRAQWLGFQECFILSIISNTVPFSL